MARASHSRGHARYPSEGPPSSRRRDRRCGRKFAVRTPGQGAARDASAQTREPPEATPVGLSGD